MILNIDYDPKRVLAQREGRILIKVPFYSAFGTGCHLATTKGHTAEDFEKARTCKAGRTVFVGQRGGLSWEGYPRD